MRERGHAIWIHTGYGPEADHTWVTVLDMLEQEDPPTIVEGYSRGGYAAGADLSAYIEAGRWAYNP